MNLPDYNSPAELKQILELNGFSMQKKFGQNFLINQNARKKLIQALEIDENSNVWEVGPGLGAMTCDILKKSSNLTVFEIDRGFILLLQKYFDSYLKENKFFIVEGDVLKTWKIQIEKKGIPDRFFGNLPYNIAAALIADTIENGVRFEKCVFTIQKEVAQRMCAKPSTNDYSSFSVLCQWAYEIKNIMDLGGGNFWPRPNVDSRAVVLTKKDDFPNCKNPKIFVTMLRSLFSSRRKTIRNNLSGFVNGNENCLEILNMAKINPMSRSESLTLEQMLDLSDIISDFKENM